MFPEHRFAAYASEARDFMATGAACGICTAFRAPLAGVMFVVEEAATFFTTQHLVSLNTKAKESVHRVYGKHFSSRCSGFY